LTQRSDRISSTRHAGAQREVGMSPWQWAATVVLVVLVPIALVITTEVDRSPFEPGEAATELAALEEKLGYPPHAVSVELGDYHSTVELQNPATPQATDEYRIEHIQALYGLIDWNRIIGPDPIQPARPGPSVPQRVFDLNPSDFTQVPRIARAAVDRVALQEPAKAAEMVLTKPTLFPDLRLGPLGWTVTVKSAHETAEASFDPTGQPTDIDLSGTIRARMLDLFQAGPPLFDIAHAITARYDGKERLDHLLVYRTSISFDLVSGGTVDPAGDYSSGINGIRRAGEGLTAAPHIAIPGLVNPNQPFATAEVDWTALPRLVTAARERLGAPDARIISVEIRKRAIAPLPPAIEWEVRLDHPSGRSGSFVFDTSGNVLTR
jgi:hypothetical protein